MRRFWIVGLLLFGHSFANVPANFQLIDNPDEILSQYFIFRSGEQANQKFYRVEMNEVIFRGVNAYFWPDEMPDSLKSKAELFAAQEDFQSKNSVAELMYNDRLVLSYSQSLGVTIEEEFIPLQSAEGVQVVKLVSPIPYVVSTYSIDSAKLQTVGKTPFFWYSDNADEHKILFLSEKESVPKDVLVSVPSEGFGLLQVQLQSIPRLESTVIDMLLDIDEAAMEEQKLILVDSLIKASDQTLENDSVSVNKQLDSLIQFYSRNTPIQSWEQDKDFAVRSELFAKQIEDLRGRIRSKSNIGLKQKEYKEKIMLMKVFRESLQKSIEEKEARKRMDARAALMKEKMWGIFYLNGFTAIGRNIPDYAADPGPTDSWGFGGTLLFSHQLHRSLSLAYELDGAVYRWKYFASMPKISEQEKGGLGVFLTYPILAGIQAFEPKVNGSMVLVRAGIVAGYGRLQVQDGQKSPPEEFEGFAALALGFDFIPSYPLKIGVKYLYDTQDFGDLQVHLGFPLNFIPKIGQRGQQ